MLTREEFKKNPELVFDKAYGSLSGLAIGDSFGDASRTVSYTHLDVYKRQPQGQVFAGTKDAAKCIGPVRWPAAAECLTRLVRGRTLLRPLSASVYGKCDMPSMRI